MTAAEWIERALQRARDAVLRLEAAQRAGGLTRAAIWPAYDQLEAAAEHLRDASIELGIGDLR